jgi:hypothetical protein
MYKIPAVFQCLLKFQYSRRKDYLRFCSNNYNMSPPVGANCFVFIHQLITKGKGARQTDRQAYKQTHRNTDVWMPSISTGIAYMVANGKCRW